MALSDFIADNKERVIREWKDDAARRLSMNVEDSQLLNDLPEFIDDLVELLRTPPDEWPALRSAERHGRQRVRIGVDPGALTEEMALVGEAIVEVARQDGTEIPARSLGRLIRAIGRGTATSVRAYAAARDKELAEQAAQHFSFMAHEIRNPLGNAKLAAELVASSGPDDRERHLERLDRALARLSDLVDDSLIEARLYAEPALELSRLPARELVEAACDEVIVQAERRELPLSIECESFELDADRKLLISALTNLLRNAVKFTRDGGAISVRARREDERVFFEVEDECGGLPAELPSRLFQPFVQASGDRSGFGLGLVIVKQAVEAHGGAVRAHDLPTRGCCFVIELPRRQAD